MQAGVDMTLNASIGQDGQSIQAWNCNDGNTHSSILIVIDRCSCPHWHNVYDKQYIEYGQ